MEALWTVITIVGPVMLAGVLAYAVVMNRRRSRAERDLTERATRDMYADPKRTDSADPR